jgi:hypothetical protein
MTLEKISPLLYGCYNIANGEQEGQLQVADGLGDHLFCCTLS